MFSGIFQRMFIGISQRMFTCSMAWSTGLSLCRCVCCRMSQWIQWSWRGSQTKDTDNLRTKILDFRGFGSSRSLISRGGILMIVGDFQETLSQQILVGIILVGRLSVRSKGAGASPNCIWSPVRDLSVTDSQMASRQSVRGDYCQDGTVTHLNYSRPL